MAETGRPSAAPPGRAGSKGDGPAWPSGARAGLRGRGLLAHSPSPWDAAVGRAAKRCADETGSETDGPAWPSKAGAGGGVGDEVPLPLRRRDRALSRRGGQQDQRALGAAVERVAAGCCAAKAGSKTDMLSGPARADSGRALRTWSLARSLRCLRARRGRAAGEQGTSACGQLEDLEYKDASLGRDRGTSAVRQLEDLEYKNASLGRDLATSACGQLEDLEYKNASLGRDRGRTSAEGPELEPAEPELVLRDGRELEPVSG